MCAYLCMSILTMGWTTRNRRLRQKSHRNLWFGTYVGRVERKLLTTVHLERARVLMLTTGNCLMNAFPTKQLNTLCDPSWNPMNHSPSYMAPANEQMLQKLLISLRAECMYFFISSEYLDSLHNIYTTVRVLFAIQKANYNIVACG